MVVRRRLYQRDDVSDRHELLALVVDLPSLRTEDEIEDPRKLEVRLSRLTAHQFNRSPTRSIAGCADYLGSPDRDPSR